MDLIENDLTGGDQGQRHPWELARYEIIKKTVKRLLKTKGGTKGNILVDIGCGDAFVVGGLSKELNFDKYHGVDINFNQTQIELLNSKNHSLQLSRDFKYIEINQESNYFILLNDVIEHVDQHKEFLASIDAHFKPANQTVIYITVPAFQELFSLHDIDLGHYRRYNLTDLKFYANLINYEIISAGHFFYSLYVARKIQKAIPRESNKIGVSNWSGSKLLTLIIKNVLLIDYRLFSRFMKFKGLSCYIIIFRK